jgi:hypothetical protein
MPSDESDQAIVKFESSDEQFPIYDLSMDGLAFSIDDLYPFERGQILKGVVILAGIDIPVEVEVMHVRELSIGCRMVAPPGTWAKTVRDYLDPMHVAKRLREVAPEYVKQQGDDGLNTRWFQGGPACDVYLWENTEGELKHVQVCYLNLVLDWQTEKGMRTGRIEEQNAHEGWGTAYKTDLFKLSSPPEQETVSLVSKLVLAAALPPKVWEIFN